MKSDLVDIACIIKIERDKAYLIDHGGKESVWVPKSLCSYDDTDKAMTMPEWLAKEKGLI